MVEMPPVFLHSFIADGQRIAVAEIALVRIVGIEAAEGIVVSCQNLVVAHPAIEPRALQPLFNNHRESLRQ